jgi:DNA-directed RNA polymerase subunit RPC12/RpoP
MHAKLTRYFTDSVAALLTAFAAALFIGNVASAKLVPPHDPLFAVSMSNFFWILGAVALVVMLVAVFSEQPRFKLFLILWFATNMIIYRLGLQWQGVHAPNGYVGSLAHAFNLSSGFTYSLLSLLFLYLFTVSAFLLFWNYLARPAEVSLKAICIHCSGHIAFSAQNLGQRIPCPHCQKETILRKPDLLLKMACYFCKEHIEFPTYAIGEKIRCPHCKMEIGLKEPA